jgi:glutathione S-transferase
MFFDMLHSNNAARIRLWMKLKRPEGMDEFVETSMITYPDLQKPEYAVINPLKKVPALIRHDGTTVFESNVILAYLDDKFGDIGVPMKPSSPEGRQEMELLMRIHDLSIASPNCTAPGFSHSQGAMYLSTGWHGPARGMDLPTRAAKIAEIWKQLNWLEENIVATPHLLGEQLTLADITWFPTCVFMEFLLPRFFGWPQLFDPSATAPRTPFPKLAQWYSGLRQHPVFASVHADIWGYWEGMEEQGQFKPLQEELASAGPGLKFTYGVPQTVELNYQEPPPAGKFTGRYINQPDKGDSDDRHLSRPVPMHDGRELSPPATLDAMGFTLMNWPTKCPDFRNDDTVVSIYYEEMMNLVKAASGAERVLIFDHTVRESGNTNLNAAKGGSAAPVPRVHCDYTATGAPRRLQQLAKEGIYSRLRKRSLTEEDVAALAKGRFAFINVWRSICDDHPVMQSPLACCDWRTVPDSDRFLYELRFPDRTGENYSLRHSADHKWYYYPRQAKDECLVFNVYDKQEDGPRFVFHTAFSDPSSPADAPPRKSIEVRAVAFFDPPPLEGDDLANSKTALGEPFVGR